MRSRGTRVRSKIVALLVSLVALWAFAAYITVQAGLNLLWINSLDQGVGRPTDALVTALQTERRLSVEYLASDGRGSRQPLDDARQATDRAREALTTSAATGSVRWAADDIFEERLDALLTSLSDLPAYRNDVDAGGPSDRLAAAADYTRITDTAFRLYDELGQYASEIADGGRTVVALSRARELLSQEDAMLSGILQAEQYSAQDPAAFAGIVGVQRTFYADAVSRLSNEDRAGYDKVIAGPEYQRFRALEEQAIAEARPDGLAPFTPAEWRAAVEPVLDQLRTVENDLADVVLERSTPAAIGILVRLALAGGLGLIAVIASIVVSITTTRHLVRQLERLRTAAEELATFRLPRVVERLQHGERVDVETEAPPLAFGRDEIGRVGEAFNVVQETAIQTAVDQAELRRSVRDVFLSLARRSQALLHRQLGLLDAMERRATDADELAELFRIDHLATRMRRNAENLIVLSGASAGRAWRRPVPMIDVVRGALAEVEDYTRVTVAPVGNALLIGRAVGDVIHLLAELIENAVSFSPPQTVVRVTGSVVGNGYAVEIEDRGLGMSEEELLAANLALRNPPEFKLSSTARLGLYVVAKLAERHGIRVQLSESSYGGTTAVILMPATLIADEDSGDITGGGAHRLDANELDGFRPSQLAAIGSARPFIDARPAPGMAADEAAPSGSPWEPPPPPVEAAPVTAAPVTVAPVTAPPVTAPTAAAAGAVSAGQPATRTEGPPPVTPAGLPWRQKPTPERQRSGQPLSGSPAPVESKVDPAPSQRRREQLSSFRSGTARGRDDASRLSEPDSPDWTLDFEAGGNGNGRTQG